MDKARAKARRFKAYLAGMMGGRLVQPTLFKRSLAKSILRTQGLDYYDPAESEGLEDLTGTTVIDLQTPEETMRQFVQKDERNLDKCDGLLILTGDTPSDGTWHELGRSLYHLKIPIVMVAPKRVARQLMGFSNIKVKYIYSTIFEAAKCLVRIAERRGYAVYRAT